MGGATYRNPRGGGGGSRVVPLVLPPPPMPPAAVASRRRFGEKAKVPFVVPASNLWTCLSNALLHAKLVLGLLKPAPRPKRGLPK